MKENVTTLQYNDKEILLIGTAHVSKESALLVKEVIEEYQPDSVCIELDSERYSNIQNPQKFNNTDLIQVIKDKKVAYLLVNLILSSYQKKMASKLDTAVGGEMIQAISSAKEANAQIVLADRNIQTTFLRAWRTLGFFEKVKLITSLVFSFGDDEEVTEDDLQNLLQQDILNAAMADVKKQFPKIGSVLIDERDKYLASKIKNAPGKKIVAVLGAGHISGISEYIYEDYSLSELDVVPPKKQSSKLIGWIIPLIIIGLIIYAFFVNFQTGLSQLSAWILWNGSLAALFSAIVLAHPLSILTAFVVAPISSLNPLLACGWFAGLVEAYVRKPTVNDLNNISEDLSSFKSFMGNRFLKTLLVVIMANLGSTLGTFIGSLEIVRNFLKLF